MLHWSIRTGFTSASRRFRILLGLAILLSSSSPAIAQNIAVLVKDIWPGSQGSFYPWSQIIADVDGVLFFNATDGTSGPELWKSDGTEEGTMRVKDIWPGPQGSIDPMMYGDFADVDGLFFFVADDGVHGMELWKSDGTEEGTILVKDIRPGNFTSEPYELTAVDGILFFRANDGTHGAELWKSDGTTEGTVLVKDMPANSCCQPNHLVNVGGTLFFASSGETGGIELWKSDGTEAGTELVKDIRPGFASSNPEELSAVGGVLFFIADDGTTGRELWKSDGTSAGTMLVKDIWPGSFSSAPYGAYHIEDIDRIAFFFADNGINGLEPWKSDGTAAGTVLIKDIRPGHFGSINPMGVTTATVNGTLFFDAIDETHGFEPWRSDGTEAGTVLIKDIQPDTLGSYPLYFTEANGNVFFSAFEPASGTEIWKSDGTTAGTVLLRDINPGTSSSSPANFINVNGSLFFAAYDETHGAELWKTEFAPEISIDTPDLDFPTVTVGDTVYADLEITNLGIVPMTVENVHIPSSWMRLNRSIPFVIGPGSTSALRIWLEPRSPDNILDDVTITVDDPITPTSVISVTTDIRALEIKGKLLSTIPKLPLGQAATVIVSPLPKVHVEEGYLHLRPQGTSVFQDSIVLSKFEDDFIAVIPGTQVTEAGFEYFFRVENSGIFSTDPPGAPFDSLYRAAVAPPDTIIVAAESADGSTIFNEKDPIQVRITMPLGAEFVEGTVFFRRGGESVYKDANLQPEGPGALGIIPGDLVGPRGIEYWIEVHSLTATVTDPPVDAPIAPRTLDVTIVNLPEPKMHPGGMYRMLSIPLSLEGTIAGSVTDDLGGPNNTVWRMFAYDARSTQYLDIPNDSISSFEIGRGYWLITRENRSIDTSPVKGQSTPIDEPFAINLEPGWNMIGNPFVFPIAWDSVFLDTLDGGWIAMHDQSTIIEPPWAWDIVDGYQDSVRVIESFEGYWVKNLMDSRVTLYIPPKEAPLDTSSNNMPMLSAGLRNDDDWEIAIRAISGDAVDFKNILGVRNGAEKTWDTCDRSEPPMSPGKSLSLYFPHTTWAKHSDHYAIDIRGEYEAIPISKLDLASVTEKLWGHIWLFDVAKNFSDDIAGDEVVIEFDGIENVPYEAAIYLVDKGLEKLIDLRKENRYTFFLGKRTYVSKEEDSRFIIFVGSEDFINMRADLFPTQPTQTTLHQNYPNPFNPSTIIRYELAQAGRVLIRVYDVSGTLVKTIEERYREPGRYEAGWNGENERGESVASGVYFFHLKAGKNELTKKMVLLK